MNSLSIWIYLAAVVPNIGAFLIIISISIIAISGGILTVVGLMLGDDVLDKDQVAQANGVTQKAVRAFYCAWLVMFVGILIPGQSTIYLMLGSEMGENVATSEQGQEMYDRLATFIDLKIDELVNTE
jgi:hypothetical protein